jgi:hypothetical protein
VNADSRTDFQDSLAGSRVKIFLRCGAECGPRGRRSPHRMK